MIRMLFITSMATVVLATGVRAQATNVEVLGTLAVECLGPVPGETDTFRLLPGARMGYLRPALTQHWLEHGYTVFLDDSAKGTGPNTLHELRYEPQSAHVDYARAGKDSLRRTVDLSISHTFVSPRGILISEAHCRQSASDVVRTDDVLRLQKDPWQETHGTIPLDRGWRTWAEPTVIGTSIAVVVYLFFSVRS
jgi:hypothetical protein